MAISSGRALEMCVIGNRQRVGEAGCSALAGPIRPRPLYIQSGKSQRPQAGCAAAAEAPLGGLEQQ